MRAAALVMLFASCTPSVADEASAERAYLGLDTAVERALALGFVGFNAASNANIAEQSDEGDVSGTMTVNGQVDQGASDNKGMRLDVALTEYADEPVKDEDGNDVEVTYETKGDPLAVDVQLKNIPDGTYDGTFGGTVTMTGDLEGDVKLTLTLSGDLEPDGAGTKRATTIVKGTAESPYGTYDVDVSR